MTNPLRFIAGGILAVLGAAFLGSCAKPNKSYPPRNPEAHKQFKSLDTNKDDKLSYAEFLKAPMARKSSNPKALFEQIDTSGEGYITIPEWRDYRLEKKKSN